jgi:hypothetical protein
MLFFEEGSPNKDIHDALRRAEGMRKAIRQREDEQFASRAADSEQATGDAEEVSGSGRRGPDRRTPSAGRSR